MAYEIERKFLVKTGYKNYKENAEKVEITQVYISDKPDATLRLRIKGEKAYLTVKSRTKGAVRHEWEYEIPFDDAIEMMETLTYDGKIVKTRYAVPFEGLIWEVDEFHGSLEGLVLAEVELKDAEQEFELPPFVGKEVTDDRRFYNSVLARATGIPH